MHGEIGGYLELERFSGPLLHEKALALSSGRACLAWLIGQRPVRKLLLPDLLCDVVEETCARYGVETRRYAVGPDLRPSAEPRPGEDEWLYLVNYYGQIREEELSGYKSRFPRLIVDNAQAYFAPPLPGTDTLYTCRKFFGVADGGFLYSDAPGRELERDESHGRMGFVLGRFERPAGEFFREASENNDLLDVTPRRMSALTENLLRAADEESAGCRRTENFLRLHAAHGTDHALDARKLVCSERLEVREVEAQAIGGHQGARLVDMVAQHVLEHQRGKGAGEGDDDLILVHVALQQLGIVQMRESRGDQADVMGVFHRFGDVVGHVVQFDGAL